MKIRFYNARIMAMQDGVSIQKGELWTKDDRILYVGSDKDPEEESFDREIDCENNLLMPGFKNAHTHSAMTFLRSMADDLPLQEWLNEQVFPNEAKLKGEEAYLFAKIAIMEYLTSGITSAFDMYIYPKEVIQACVDCGFRIVQVSGLNNFTSSLSTESILSLISNKSIFSVVLSFPSIFPYTFSSFNSNIIFNSP